VVAIRVAPPWSWAVGTGCGTMFTTDCVFSVAELEAFPCDIKPDGPYKFNTRH